MQSAATCLILFDFDWHNHIASSLPLFYEWSVKNVLKNFCCTPNHPSLCRRVTEHGTPDIPVVLHDCLFLRLFCMLSYFSNFRACFPLLRWSEIIPAIWLWETRKDHNKKQRNPSFDFALGHTVFLPLSQKPASNSLTSQHLLLGLVNSVFDKKLFRNVRSLLFVVSLRFYSFADAFCRTKAWRRIFVMSRISRSWASSEFVALTAKR